MQDITLLQLFTDDIGHAQSLLALIEDELDALEKRDLPRLESILSNKRPLLAQLDEHGSQRSQLLLSLQLSPDLTGLQALAERSPKGDELLGRSRELSELLERCQNANQRNGQLIRANQLVVGSILGILRGTETPNLYDSRGGAAKIAQQRPLSQA
ncbi:flagellar protein FlgN [Pseudomonas sp. RIT-PI-AD]|uniref:flagella synthesis protein FlgN n=1 Tax=Pseudomonas sp. RIT-PI-AD TaxID=3035294 RepID=UPI0021DB751F|nr:flagellar protein FlgN [Pseudomonas sp. RIT-PI-AD]